MAGSKKENIHAGHRQRMRERFEQSGCRGFSQHEILEMLLYYTYPQINTNGMAHDLISKFGSIAGLIDAPVDTLLSEGVTFNTVILLKLIPQTLKFYYNERVSTECFDTGEKLRSLMLMSYIGVNIEEFRLVCLSSDLRVISNSVIDKGSQISSPVNMRKILEKAFSVNSFHIVIAHNHPGMSCAPTENDIYATRHIMDTVRSVGIHLIDHIIIGTDGAFSMQENATMGIFDS